MMLTHETQSMPSPYAATHHRESMQKFLDRDLLALLGKVLPLDGCSVRATDKYSAELTLIIATGGEGKAASAAVLTFTDLPWPDENGIFSIESLRDTPGGPLRVVVPTASGEDLSRAVIRCVGDFLGDEIAGHLERNHEALSAARSADDLRVALPIDEWICQFFLRSQRLDATNYLARHTHPRRIRVLGPVTGFSPGQIGRVCPFENPEGPNTGRILALARGAAIRDGKIIVVDDSPASSLGLSASLIPFIGHSEPARLMMGANMVRQWQVLSDQEPPLVQTGLEPAADSAPQNLWCGRNLLTAFISWGPGTHEDGLIVSESCAARLSVNGPLMPGDKLSNRHGSKGVIGQILPDAEMPHLPDGTPVEIIYSAMSVFTRMNHGQLLEAALGRIAHAEGKTVIVPPFDSPCPDDIRVRLRQCGLPETGQEILTAGRDGEPLDHPSTVGYVYWGRTAHDAAGKVVLGYAGEFGLQEYAALRQVGANHLISNIYGGEAAARRIETLRDRLATAGIATRFGADGLFLTWDDAPMPESTVMLAQPIAHPWRRERQLTTLTDGHDLPGMETVRSANDRLQRILSSGAPASLALEARNDVERSVALLFRDLLNDAMAPTARPAFTARTVAAPGLDLAIDKVGLPDTIIRAFWPAAAASGAEALDAALGDAIVLVNGFYPSSLLACRPARLPAGENVIRLHPAHCTLLDSDFDGDQLLVTLPQTPEAQQEAAALLSPAAILARNPDSMLYGGLHAGLFGIAYLSLTEEGRATIQEALAGAARLPDGLWTKQTQRQVLGDVLRNSGAAATLALWERLLTLGFAAAKRSGASLRPFVGETLTLPPGPGTADPASWALYAAQIQESLERQAARGEFEGSDIGQPLLAATSGARGRTRFLAFMIAAAGSQVNGEGVEVAMTHGWREGYAFHELLVNAEATRKYWRSIYSESSAVGEEPSYTIRGAGFLARTLRSSNPGVVFAAAAERRETDPLRDLDARIFAGLAIDGI